MSNVILSTKLRNLISKNANIELEFYLKNISINGRKTGCSGFIRNPKTNLIVYTNTEHSVYAPLSNKFLYRYAEDLQDYGGPYSFNLWANSEEDLAKKIVRHLESEVHYFE